MSKKKGAADKWVFEGEGAELVLMPHQVEAIEVIRETWKSFSGFSLNDDMGLGKTITSICAILAFHEQNLQGKRILIACPKAVIEHWLREIIKVIKGKFWFYNYSGVKRDEELNTLLETAEREDVVFVATTHQGFGEGSRFCFDICWDVLVIDESHVLRNSETLMFHSIVNLKRVKTLLLTGTPFNNKATDMASQCVLIDMPIINCHYELPVGVAKRQMSIEKIIKSPGIIWGVEGEWEPVKTGCSLAAFNHRLVGSFKLIETFPSHLWTVRGMMSGIEEIEKICLANRRKIRDEQTGIMVFSGDPKRQFLELKRAWSTCTINDICGLCLRTIRLMLSIDEGEPMIEVVIALDGVGLADDVVNLFEVVKAGLVRRAAITHWRGFWQYLLYMKDLEAEGGLEILAPVEKIAAKSAISAAGRLIRRFTIRRTKSQVREICDSVPPMEIEVRYVKLNEAESHLNRKVAEEFLRCWSNFTESMLINGGKGDVTSIITTITKWRQIVSLPELKLCHSKLWKGDFTYLDFLKKRQGTGKTGSDIDNLVYEVAEEKYGWKLKNPELVSVSESVSESELEEKETEGADEMEEEELNLIDEEVRGIPVPRPAGGIGKLRVAPLSSKLRGLLDLIYEIVVVKGEKCVVFSCWVGFLRICAEHLAAKGIWWGILEGSMSIGQRSAVVSDFGELEGGGVLLGSIKACGVGINLTCATTCIFCETSWNPFGEELQAMQRIHRIGQTKRTKSIYLVAKDASGIDTIDGFMRDLQDGKVLGALNILGEVYITNDQRSRVVGKQRGKLSQLAKIVRGAYVG